MKGSIFVAVVAGGFLFVGLAAAAQDSHDHMKGMDMAPSKSDKAGNPAALQPAEGASIKIISPTKGQVFKGDKVPIEFKLTKGKRGSHAHAYVDGELVGMFESEKGTLNGIKPGKHTLELRVVTKDHRTELNAKDRVQFEVK